jgi:hypothetical protein
MMRIIIGTMLLKVPVPVLEKNISIHLEVQDETQKKFKKHGIIFEKANRAKGEQYIEEIQCKTRCLLGGW